VSLGIGHAAPDTKESRKVFKQGKEIGFDLSNTHPALKNHHVRKNKPSFDNLIKIF
jgi:hypothetical protein